MSYLFNGFRRRLFPLVYRMGRLMRPSFDLCVPGGDSTVGGPNTFRANFRSILEKNNVSVTDNPLNRYKSLLVIQYFDYTKLRAIRKSGVRIVQRLDGLAYPEWAGDGWKEMNAPVARLYHEFADEVIFQSEYSARQADEFLGPRHPSSGVVVNGVEVERFKSKGELKAGSPVRLVTSGNFRLSHLIVPQIEALRNLRKNGFAVELSVVGPIADEGLEWTSREPGVRYLGKVPREKVATYLSDSDIFVFSMLNAACPNSVIEAIASGLPVVGFQSGSLPELCAFNPDLLVPMPERLIHTDDDADGSALSAKIAMAISDFSRFKRNALEHRGDYSMESTFQKYRKSLRI